MQHTELGECCVVQPAVPAARLELPKCQRHFKAPAKSEIRFCHSFSGFFWVTGKMLICLWQKADRDTRLPDLCRNNPLSHEDLACRSDEQHPFCEGSYCSCSCFGVSADAAEGLVAGPDETAPAGEEGVFGIGQAPVTLHPAFMLSTCSFLLNASKDWSASAFKPVKDTQQLDCSSALLCHSHAACSGQAKTNHTDQTCCLLRTKY